MRFPTELLRLFLVVGALGVAMGCDLSTTAPDAGAYYTITADLKDSSTYPAGTILSVPIHVTHDGAAVWYATVHWVVQSGHGLISDTVSTTDTLGATHIAWTLGAAPEANILLAGIGDAVDTFYVTGTIGSPSYLVMVGAQSDTVSRGEPIVLRVLVKDRPGNNVPGATVTWVSSGGSLSASDTTSDATGTAMVAFAATEAGTYHVTADLPERATCIFEIVVR